ncbi:transmembrane proteins 14C-domain-containing protein [Mycena crocata]|nr:transmembrane proteins 14C-domain-containing protein [Mycena crocata]
MSAYPAFAMGGLCIAGGVAAFARTRSLPSLVAGVGVGAVYLWAGDRIRRGEDNGLEAAVAASTLLLASTAPRLLRTRTLAPGPIRAPVPRTLPALLAASSLAAGGYYGKKIVQLRRI